MISRMIDPLVHLHKRYFFTFASVMLIIVLTVYSYNVYAISYDVESTMGSSSASALFTITSDSKHWESSTTLADSPNLAISAYDAHTSTWSLYSEHPFLHSGLGSSVTTTLPSPHTTKIIQISPDLFSLDTQNQLKRYLVFGSDATVADTSSLETSALDEPKQLLPQSSIFSVSVLSDKDVSFLSSRGYTIIEDQLLELHYSAPMAHNIPVAASSTLLPNIFSIRQDVVSDISSSSSSSRLRTITGLDDDTSLKYNATGDGITVAIMDTGVDFSNMDLRDALARDSTNNHPLMLDADGQGIVLTNATFLANIDSNGLIKNHTKESIHGTEKFTSYVYVTKEGIFLDVKGNKMGGVDIPVYNSFFPKNGLPIVFNGTLRNDMKIGENSRDYIKSQSGVYRLGVIFQAGPTGIGTGIQAVPVLVTDSYASGIYNTIIPDMSSSWMDYMRPSTSDTDLTYDFDFTDESSITLGSGNEFLVYDSDKDGVADYTAGTVGARVLDVHGVTSGNASHVDDALHAINGTLLLGLDPSGHFFGVMSDSRKHGTSSAATVASRGVVTYDIYNNSGTYTLPGVAPGSKILPIKALWLGDAVYGWLWAAGFDNYNNTWQFSGAPRTDIISNSWGLSAFPLLGSIPGMDPISLFSSVLATPRSIHTDYPGVLMISSAGNSGHGYGTIAPPGASSLGITVGATTNNNFVGYGPFKDQPRFGNTTDHYNHIVDFSSKGPVPVGDPKPDIVSIGAHGFVSSSVMGTDSTSGREPFALFGGTSMAAPAVAGAAAVIMGAMTNNLMDYDPYVIRNILMSTARDLHNDPFTQGAGLVNVGTALDYVYGVNGTFVVYNDASYDNIRKVLTPAIQQVNLTGTGLVDGIDLPMRNMPLTGWFAGHLTPGERSTTKYTIENPSDDTIHVKMTPVVVSLIHQTHFEGETIPMQQDPVLNKSGIYTPNYVKLTDVRTHETLGGFFDADDSIPDEASLMILTLNFAFDDFMNDATDVYADDLGISSLYLYDWVDSDNDTIIKSSELSMVSRGGSWGTGQEIRVSDPASKFDGIPLVGVYPVPLRYSYWLGATGQNATSMPYVLSASYYQKEPWSLVWSGSSDLQVAPQNTKSMDVTIVTPPDLSVGAYQGFLEFASTNHIVSAPVSFIIKQQVDTPETFLVDGVISTDVMYGNGYTQGAFDMIDRYMAGDWRLYHFDIINDTQVGSASVELSWVSEKSSLSVFVADPTGKIIQTNAPPGIFEHLLGWPTVDWLGGSPFSEGGGFYPVSADDTMSTSVHLPIDMSGTYTVLVHSTLFGGTNITEPITFQMIFSNDLSMFDITPKMPTIGALDPPVIVQKDDFIQTTKSNSTIIHSQIQSQNQDASNITTMPQVATDTTSSSFVNSTPDLSFNIGLAVGIIVGLSIGIFILLVTKKRSDTTIHNIITPQIIKTPV